MDKLKIGEVLTTESGQRLFVVGVVVGRSYYMVRIPDGMSAMDLGRRFRHEPTEEDPLRAVLIGHLQDEKD